MLELELRALAAVRENWAPGLDDVWAPNPYHVHGLQDEAEQLILAGFRDALDSDAQSPVGIALRGQPGSGKTHLLGSVREGIQRAGGYFFVIQLLDSSAFWRSTALSLLDGFDRPAPDGDRQVRWFLRRLADRVDVPRTVRRSVSGETPLARAALDAFVDAIYKTDRAVGRESQDAARALALLAADPLPLVNIGHQYLCANEEENPGERAAWGIRQARRADQQIVRDISQLLALTGPTVLAVDQIEQSSSVLGLAATDGSIAHLGPELRLAYDRMAGGLMALREITRRTLTIVSCMEHTWLAIANSATKSVNDRFRTAGLLKGIPSAAVGEALLERRLALSYRRQSFGPPYPTWPFAPAAFAGAVDLTPRDLLKAADRAINEILQSGQIIDVADLRGAVDAVLTVSVAASAAELSRLDGRFADLCRDVDVKAAVDPSVEDDLVPHLIAAGLTAWIAEQGAAGRHFTQDPLPGTKPSLHARLRRRTEADSEGEEHWSFRAIAADQAIAFLNRLRNAITASGVTEGPARRLLILHNGVWPQGQRNEEERRRLESDGGQKLPFTEDDIRRLTGLRRLIEDEDEATLRAWFLARRPTQDIGLLRDALADAVIEPAPAGAVSLLGGLTGPTPVPPITHSENAVVLGRAVAGAEPVLVDLSALRTHAAIFAGSGSGKTVFLRRLIEECALRGVSSIVLDPNNDLARLGDPWPEPPSTWDGEDAVRAKDYLDNTDVVVWTPRREAGRPLSFQPLPDFAGLLDDPDEFSTAVDVAVGALAPRARVHANNARSEKARAVLRQALHHFAHTGNSHLPAFIELLQDLPDSVSRLPQAAKTAAEMAHTLAAAMVNDPLFGGGGVAADPGTLLTPAPGKRSRVSVISFIGLPEPEQQQGFVNQLQLALFAWIKRNPARDRPLGGLFVMDEAQTLAPTGALTPCTQSTLALVSQARKYGLGLVFATQAPRGLQPGIPGNSATQLFGRLNSPAYVAAAREMARAKGTDMPDVGGLSVGEFYAAAAGSGFRKIQTPACLSHHPSGPLTIEEVLERARPSTP